MSLIARHPRPLSRDTGSLRDDRLFIIACDDTYAPKQYFDFFRIRRIQIHVVETSDGSSASADVLKRLLQIEHEADDELWLLLDVDHQASGPHLRSLTNTIAEARRHGVNVVLNKPCFELWLLLHHVEESAVTDLRKASDVARSLRSVLGEYNKTRLKGAHFPIESVPEACIRAERLDNTVSGGDIPSANTARVYRIWKSVVAKALPSQLPDAIRRILP